MFVALFRRVRADASLRDPLTREALAEVARRGLTLPADLVLDLLAELDRPGAPRRLIAGVLDDRAWALARLNSGWVRQLERPTTSGRRPSPPVPSGDLVALLRATPGSYDAVDASLTGGLDAALTNALLDVVEEWLTNLPKTRWPLPKLVRRLALQGDVASAPRAAARLQAAAEHLPDAERALRRSLTDAATALEARAALVSALAVYPVLHPFPDAAEEG